MVVAEDAGKSPGSHVIAVIARDRKTKSHPGDAEKNWGLTAKDAKDAKECKTYHGDTEARRGRLPKSPELPKNPN